MEEKELARCHELLGLSLGCGIEELEHAYTQKDTALQQGGLAGDRERLRLAHNAVAAHVRSRLRQQRTTESRTITMASTSSADSPAASSNQSGMVTPVESGPAVFPLFAFDNWRVNVLVPPLLLGLVWLVNHSPLGFFLKGFHVWMHEFGHATAAWMCGRRATPLPLGWTPVEPEYSSFVYFGLLLLFGILFAAGWKERKIWPMLAAVALGLLQGYMTWRMPELRQEFWWGAFGGVGGEFYLSALLMAFFFVELPEKFRWGACRYVFFLIGATAFLNITGFWALVYHGVEEIPFGSMINGEDDQGGDMNKLMDIYGWTRTDIRQHYHALGRWCWIGLGVVYAVYVSRLNRFAGKVADQVVEKMQAADDAIAG